MNMSASQRKALFRRGQFRHLNLVADPGSHSYKECLVSVAYNWQRNMGCYPLWQWVIPSRHLLDSEVAMETHIERQASEGRLERVGTYRLVQSLSNQIKELTSGEHTLDSFSMPGDSNLRALRPGEKREFTESEDGNQRHAL